MLKNTITEWQMQTLLTMFWLGTLILLGYDSILKQDSWAGILLAAIMFIPLLLLYVRIIHLFPCQDLFSIMIKIFGNLWGKILSGFMIFYAIYLGGLVLKHTSQFVTDLSLGATPQALLFVFLSLLALGSLLQGAENLGRLSKIAHPIIIWTIIITTVIGFKEMDFNNLKPILHTDYKTLVGQSLILLSFPFGESIICLPFFGAVSSLVNPLKVFLKALGVTTGIIILANLRNILILGTGTANMYYYPSYASVSIISLGDFFTRIEVLIGLNLVMAGFFKFAACVYTSSLGFAKLLNLSTPKHAFVQSILLMFALATMVYPNTIEMLEGKPYYAYATILFQIIIPLIILIGAEIKIRKKPPKLPASPQVQASPQK